MLHRGHGGALGLLHRRASVGSIVRVAATRAAAAARAVPQAGLTIELLII